MEFKDKIKSRRTELDLTMEELAKKVGVSTPTIQRYESGEIQNVRRDKIKLLADALQCSPDYLMDWDHQPTKAITYYETNTRPDMINEDPFPYGIAAHKENNENWTPEELKKIEEYKQLLLAARNNKKQSKDV